MRVRCCLAVAVALFLLPSLSGSQPAPAPGDPGILGYLHLDTPWRVAIDLPGLLQSIPVQLEESDLVRAFGAPIGDAKLGLIDRRESILIVWLQNPNPAGEPLKVVVLPDVADTFYLAEAAREVGLVAASVQGMSLMSSRSGLDSARTLLEPIRALRQQNYSSPISAFLSGDACRIQIESAMEALLLRSPQSLIASIMHVPLDEDEERNVPDLPFWRTMISQLAREVEALQLQVDFAKEGVRVVCYATPRSGGGLADFATQEAAAPNPLVRYLPASGWLRMALSTEPLATRRFVQRWVAMSLNDSQIGQPDKERLAQIFDSALEYGSPAAFGFPGPAGEWSNFIAVVTPRSTEKEVEPLLHLRQALRPAGAPPESLSIDDSRLYENEFRIYRLIASPDPREPALLSACFGDSLMLFSPSQDQMIQAMRRALRLHYLEPPLQSQSVFLPGGHFYADIRLSENADPDDNGWIRVFLMAGEGKMQFAAEIPYAALIGLLP